MAKQIESRSAAIKELSSAELAQLAKRGFSEVNTSPTKLNVGESVEGTLIRRETIQLTDAKTREVKPCAVYQLDCDGEPVRLLGAARLDQGMAGVAEGQRVLIFKGPDIALPGGRRMAGWQVYLSK